MTEETRDNITEKAGKRTGEKIGKVWIAGAGPGDVRLLTLRAMELIRRSDVIVYDALISAEILSQIPSGTETIDVGKQSGTHPVPQEEISRILVQEAGKGKQVLRLKGGDPFVFGRGGEELEILTREGIPFEVIPGITSAVAVPAYAGIPVTHRDYASSFHVITGHGKKDGKPDIDFPALARMKGTLVFLMSVASMEEILSGLLKAGMDENTPAVVLEKGTTAGQRIVTAALGTLKEKADREKIGTPSIVLVGEVCRLSKKLHWAGDRILGGRQFLITRPAQQSAALAGRLRELGAQVIEMPAIRTEPVESDKDLDTALERLGTRTPEEWLVFTSPAGVEMFFEQMKKRKLDLRDLFGRKTRIRIGAIGPGTGKALEHRGIFPDVIPDVYNAKALGEAIARQAAGESYVTVARAEKGSPELIPPIVKAGLTVQDVPLYHTEYETAPFLSGKVQALLRSGEIDAVTFTSASTVEGFVRAVKEPDLLRQIQAVCIGEQTAWAAERYGMRTVRAAEATIDGVADKIIEVFGREGS